MSETHVSIGRVKRDLSELVNRVAYGGERIMLTSRGKPKAALVSIADYERLEREREQRSAAGHRVDEPGGDPGGSGYLGNTAGTADPDAHRALQPALCILHANAGSYIRAR